MKGESSDLVRVLSQSTVVGFLASHISHFTPEIKNVTLKKMGIGKQANVVSVEYTTPAIHAFYQMYLRNVSAVAIVNSDGNLIANLSISDLRVRQKIRTI